MTRTHLQPDGTIQEPATDGLKQVVRLFRERYDSHDRWGSVMIFWFVVADEVHYNRPEAVPATWGFSPGLGGEPGSDDADLMADLHDVPTEALIGFGHALDRASQSLQAKGEDY